MIANAAPLLCLMLLGFAVKNRKPQRFTAHGTARWAESHEVPQGDGLNIGEMAVTHRKSIFSLFNPRVSSRVACESFLGIKRDRVVKLSSVHTAVFAPTGVGKGVSCVIPHLLSCTDSCVVVDFKGENALITAEARRAMGHKVVILDPFKVVTQTPDTLNPLDFIPADSEYVIDEARDLAGALVVRTGKESEPHWNDSSEVWISAMTAAAILWGGEK